jgi:hypothetical protein
LFRTKSPEERTLVSVDDWGVRCARPDGTVECVAWDELEAVEVHTTQYGPFIEDVFFVLIGSMGCVVPQLAQGTDELVARLVALPGFDDERWAKAMSSTTEARFRCWQRTR